MPSDERTKMALEALSAAREAFRSAIAAAANEVGGRLAAYRGPGDDHASRTALELGPFAAGRLDPARFSELVRDEGELDIASGVQIKRAFETLTQLARGGPEMFQASVAPGGDLREVVGRALAGLGRAFAAARVAEMARLGRTGAEEISLALGFPVRFWNRAERGLAPPLVVEVDGGDAQAGGLAEFLTGSQKIVLVVRGPSPPAPLLRLITPGVLVMQTNDAADLAAIAAATVPAIAALVPAEAARFTHMPGGGPVWKRLQLAHAPAQEPLGQVGSFTSHQQVHELAWLRQLATPPEGGAGVGGAQDGAVPSENGGPADSAAAVATGSSTLDPVDKLAAWLLSEAELRGPS